MQQYRHLDDELLCLFDELIGVRFKRSPSSGRKDLVGRQAIHERLLVLEESTQTLDEVAGFSRRRVIETTKPLVE